MKTYRLRVEVEPLEDGRFLAVASNLRGCLAEGDTPGEAIENLEDNARLLIDVSKERGWALPPEMEPDGDSIVRGDVFVRA